VAAFTDPTSRLEARPVVTGAQIYAALGVRLTHDPTTAGVDAEVSPSQEMLGKTSVRGVTWHMIQRIRLQRQGVTQPN
jgi:hypothetical protein